MINKKKKDQIITLKNTLLKTYFYDLILKILYIVDQYLAD